MSRWVRRVESPDCPPDISPINPLLVVVGEGRWVLLTLPSPALSRLLELRCVRPIVRTRITRSQLAPFLGRIDMQSIRCGLLLLQFHGLCSVGHSRVPYKKRPNAPMGRDSFGGISRPVVKYRGYRTCSQYSQPYPVGDSSDAAFRCQYCSTLFVVAVKIGKSTCHRV